MVFSEKKIGDLCFMTAPTISSRHAFTTRYGGVSEGIYASMNLGTGRGDEDEKIRENYRLLAEATGIDTLRMAFTKQVHKADVRIVDEGDIHELFTAVPYEADGIVTAAKGLGLICFTADCVPVLLEDSVHGVIGAIHCGWRSSVGDILGNALEAMCSLGAERKDIHAAIGPAISECCFQVGGEVIEAVERWLGEDARGFYKADQSAEGKFLLDLKLCNARRLMQLGVKEENIAVSDECTKCSHEKYWSHRHTNGQRGSQGALIVLE